MSQRRMFSPDIVCSDAFLDMPVSSQALYFQLGMSADDDGFVNPRRIMRNVGASDDDLKVLLAKRFLLSFEGGVVVIKHWLIHNLIRHDRYKPTQYFEHKSTLSIKENKAYTELATVRQPNGNQLAPQVRLGKVSKEVATATFSPSEISVVATDSEGREKPPRRQQAVLYPHALKLRDKLYDILEKDTGVRSTPHMGDYARVSEALKVLTEKQVQELFEEAVERKQVHTVREVLTARNIDIYRQENI